MWHSQVYVTCSQDELQVNVKSKQRFGVHLYRLQEMEIYNTVTHFNSTVFFLL